jgi:uncharacterized protein
MNNKILGIDKNLLEKITQIILRHKEAEKIIIFGSRAGGCFKDTSDIDITILGKNWTDTDINLVKDNLDEDIKIPLKFDVLNFYEINKDKLKEDILKKGIVIYGKD